MQPSAGPGPGSKPGRDQVCDRQPGQAIAVGQFSLSSPVAVCADGQGLAESYRRRVPGQRYGASVWFVWRRAGYCSVVGRFLFGCPSRLDGRFGRRAQCPHRRCW